MTYAVEPLLGMHVLESIKVLVDAANRHGSARMEFNGLNVTAKAGDTTDAIYAAYKKMVDEARVAWLNSPEGAAHQAARDAEIDALQSRHDDLLSDLAHLDWGSDVAVLDWVCAMQPVTDDIGVAVNKTAILDAFAAHGYLPDQCVGDSYVAGDRAIEHRYLIGQALSTLQVCAMHGMIQDFAAKWRAAHLAP